MASSYGPVFSATGTACHVCTCGRLVGVSTGIYHTAAPSGGSMALGNLINLKPSNTQCQTHRQQQP